MLCPITVALASVLASGPGSGPESGPDSGPGAASTPKPQPTLAELDDKRFELHVGARGGGRFMGAGPSWGGGLEFGLGLRVWRGLYFEAGVAEGVYSNREPVESFRHAGHLDESSARPEEAATQASAASDRAAAILAGQIVFGLRYEIRTRRTQRVRPTVFLGATHLHEATLDDFRRRPGATLAGVADGIRHRTGVQAGAGLRAPFPARWGPVAPRFALTVKADVAYYFDREPGRLQASGGVGVQVTF